MKAKMLLSLALTLLAAPTSGQTQTLKFKDHGKIIKELSIEELKKIIPSEHVKIADALEFDDVTYEAFPINEIFKKVYGGNGIPTGAGKAKAEELLFTCADGYQPSLPLTKFDERDGYLAFKREGKSEFSIVNKREANKKINVGPFYLVWKKKTPNDPYDENSWPYQVVSLDLVNFSDAFPKLAPPTGSSQKVIRGFLAFRNNCAGCHTLNGDGGKGGPELNYPVNITEYYKVDWLKKWIGNPTGIRFKTGMPGLDKNMPGREAVIDDIIHYFEAMKNNKIKPTGLP